MTRKNVAGVKLLIFCTTRASRCEMSFLVSNKRRLDNEESKHGRVP